MVILEIVSILLQSGSFLNLQLQHLWDRLSSRHLVRMMKKKNWERNKNILKILKGRWLPRSTVKSEETACPSTSATMAFVVCHPSNSVLKPYSFFSFHTSTEIPAWHFPSILAKIILLRHSHCYKICCALTLVLSISVRCIY